MPNVIRIAVVDPNDSSRERLKGVLLGLETVWLEAECSRYAFFVDVVDQTKPDIGFIAMDADPPRAIKLITETLQKFPGCSILVSSSSTDGRLILESMRAGAKEFLTEPLRPEDLNAALQRVRRQASGASPSKRDHCQIFSVAGATGGVFLDTIPEYTLADVAQNVERLDLTLLKKSLTKHSSGVHLLPRPMQLDEVRLITQDKLQRVLGLLKTSFTHIVIDASKGFSELDLLAMRTSDDVLMVTQLDLPCLRNVVRLLMTFDEEDVLREKLKIIVNRVGHDSGQISLKKARDTIGRDIYWQIPNDYRVMVEVRNNGVPLLQHAPKAGITQSIGQLANALIGKASDDDAAAGDGKSRRWLSLWPSR
jgi:pilus assembly protein CpaE